MEVQYIDHMGSDLDVANCARVSFDKWNTELAFEKDSKLIQYLAKHKHWSPFSHQYVKFRFSVPMFVRNQLYKHMIGLNVGEAINEEMAWNEVSRRYVDYPPKYFKPMMWRKKASDKKQGSLDEEVDNVLVADMDYNSAIRAAQSAYHGLLTMGVCPEQARMILPQCVYTDWIWTGSLVAWHRIAKQRLQPDTQVETRMAIGMIVPHFEKHFPISWKALQELA